MSRKSMTEHRFAAPESLVMALVLLVEISWRLARREAGLDLIALVPITAALVFEETSP